MHNIQRIEEPEMNREIVVLFLRKVELLTPEERRVLIQTINILNHPVLLTTP